ncbi:MAG: hypothetical protein KC591_03020 [Gemmatimonadetes bacterium]|nr:hypothetical protein [Gemmatimonadota bacterium]
MQDSRFLSPDPTVPERSFSNSGRSPEHEFEGGAGGPPHDFRVRETVSARSFRAETRESGEILFLKRARSRSGARREARFLRRAASPFVPELRRIRRDSGAIWLGTGWIDAPNALRADLPASFPTDLLRAIAHLHRRGIVHGDLAPRNVLVRPENGSGAGPAGGPAGGIVLLDLEFAASIGEDLEFDQAGGTAGFVAPERLAGWPADPRSDLYSWARILEFLPVDTSPIADLVRACLSDSAARRPADASSLLEECADACGRGSVPAATLDQFRWGSSTPSPSRLARGFAEVLGADLLASQELADVLLENSGGDREVASDLVQRWIREVFPDPWCRQRSETFRHATSDLERISRARAEGILTSLDPDSREVASRIAQLGPEFSWKEVSAVFPDLDRERKAGLATLLRDDGDRATFRTPRLHEAARDRLDAVERAGTHARILEHRRPTTSPADPLATFRLAEHARLAGLELEFREFAFRAGRAALDRGLRREAHEYCRQAWESCGFAADSPPSGPLAGMTPDEAGERVYAYGNALVGVGRADDADRWFDALLAVRDDEGARIRRHAGRAHGAHRRGEADVTLREADAGLAIAPTGPRAALLHLRRAQAFEVKRDLASAETAATRALELAGERPSVERTAASLLLGAVAARAGRWRDADAHWTQAFESARDARHHFTEGIAQLNVAAARIELGALDEALEFIDATARVAREHGFFDLEWMAVANAAEVLFRREAFGESARRWELARDLALRAGHVAEAVRFGANLGRTIGRTGRLPLAETHLREALELAERGPEACLAGVLEAHLWRFEITAWFRPTEAGRESAAYLARHETELERFGLRSDFRLIAAADAINDGDAARAAERIEAGPARDDLAAWHALAAARLARASGRMADGLAGLDAALSRDRTSPRFERALLFLERASLREATFRSDLDHAIESAREIGARWIEAIALDRRARSDSPEDSRG